MDRKILFLDAQIIFTILFLSYAWEFYLEDSLFSSAFSIDFVETSAMKWRSIFINVFFASIAVLIPSWYFVSIEEKRKKLEDEIKVFTKFAEFSGQGFVVSDMDGVISYVNPAFIRMVQAERIENVDGKNILSYYPKEIVNEHKRKIDKAVLELGQWTGELSLLAQDGSDIPVIENIFPVYDDENNPRYLVHLITDISEQKYSERAIKQLPKKLIQAQESERQRIATDLHDSLAQNLLVIQMDIQKAIDTIGRKKDGDYPLNRTSNLISETLEQINEIAYNLRPPILDKIGLEKAIAQLAETISLSSGIKIFVEIDFEEYSAPKDLEINIYRIIQEALNNVIKHSGAKKVYIDITTKNEVVDIHISDDGKGFDESTDDPLESLKGKGLEGITERVKIFDGKIAIDSTTGEGATLSISFPIKKDVKQV